MTPHRELQAAAVEADAAAQRRPARRATTPAPRRSCASPSASTASRGRSAPPGGYGRLVGMLKAAILRGDAGGAAAYARAALAAADASPTAAYALALAAWRRATTPPRRRPPSGWPRAARRSHAPRGRWRPSRAATSRPTPRRWRAVIADFERARPAPHGRRDRRHRARAGAPGRAARARPASVVAVLPPALEAAQLRGGDPQRHGVVGRERLGRPRVALDERGVLRDVVGQRVRRRIVARPPRRRARRRCRRPGRCRPGAARRAGRSSMLRSFAVAGPRVDQERVRRRPRGTRRGPAAACRRRSSS